MMRANAWWRHPYLRHLRLNFNLFLSPIYLWGVLLVGGALVDWRTWIGYLTLHAFLGGGANAFNSYYDKDEGPISGLLEPPPVDPGLLRFSLLFQALGLPLALLLGAPFTLGWLVLFALSAAYSHPLVRLKANPYLAIVTVAVGQGAFGFALGWLTPAGSRFGTLVEPVALLGMLTTGLVLMGLYIVTQSYQSEEDRARGDRTLPVILGPRRALLAALAILTLGGLLMSWWVRYLFGLGWTLALVAFFVIIGGWLLRWALSFDEQAVVVNFRQTMRFAAVASGGLSLFLIWHLLS